MGKEKKIEKFQNFNSSLLSFLHIVIEKKVSKTCQVAHSNVRIICKGFYECMPWLEPQQLLLQQHKLNEVWLLRASCWFWLSGTSWDEFSSESDSPKIRIDKWIQN